MKRLLVIILTIFVGGTAAACDNNSTSESPVENFVEYEAPSYGLSFKHPEGWVTADSFTGVTLAPDQVTLDMSDFSELGEGAVVVFIPSELPLMEGFLNASLDANNPEGTLNAYIARLTQADGQLFTTIDEPEPFTVGDQNAAIMTVENTLDGVPLTQVIAAIHKQHLVAIVAGISAKAAAATHRPTFEAIIQSTTLGQPTAE